MHPERESRLKPGRKPSPNLREAIVAAALRLFAADGVEGTSTRAIAASAQTTERTLFKHFGSKEGLVQAVVEAVSIETVREASYSRVWQETPFSRAEFAQWHRRFITERIEAAEASPDNYRVLFREIFRDDAFRQRYAIKWQSGVFEPLARHLELLQTAGGISGAHSPRALAGMFFSLNLGYLLSRYALAPLNEWQTERDVDAIVGMFMSACGQPPSAVAKD